MAKDIFNVGLLTPYISGNYFGNLINSIHEITHKEGARLFVIQTCRFKHRPSDKSMYHYKLSFENMDGWIILPQSVEAEYFEEVLNLGKPVVQVSREIENSRCHYVMPDNTRCVKEATLHLIDHGYKEVAFVGCFDMADVRERHEGYAQALKEAGIPYNPQWVFKISSPLAEGGIEAVDSMLKLNYRVTAVVAGTDSNAVGVMQRFTEAGYKIPDDVAIIGFDDMDFAKYTLPPLTSIHQNISEMGSTAAKTLLEKLKTKSEAMMSIYVESKVVLRQSCGCPVREGSDIAEKANVESDLSIKVVSYLGKVLLNNFIIGNTLNRANIDQLKQMTWLEFTNYQWACAGFWDNKSLQKELVIDQFFSLYKELPSPLGQQYILEKFPPVDYLPESTYQGEDIVWLHPIMTEKREWGILALVGPMDKMRIHQDFDTMSDRYELLAYALEREELSDRYRHLLNNVGQGFLSFGRDLLIESEYSQECKKIFGKDIQSKFFPEIITPDDTTQQEFFKNIFSDILNETNDNKIHRLIGLLPDNFFINNRNIHFDYKVIEDSSVKRNKKMILILTDISDRVKLENKVEYERNTLKMVVKSMVCYNEFVDLIKDYKYFSDYTLRELFDGQQTSAEIIAEVLRNVHTFKGNFAQMEMVNITKNLNDLEIDIIEYKNKAQELSIHELSEFLFNKNLHGYIETDLSILKGILGDQFYNEGNKVIISEDRIKAIEKTAISILTPYEIKTILPEIRKLRYKPLTKLIKYYLDYTFKLAQRLGKAIHPIMIKSEKDIFVAEEKYHEFVKSLVHVFRNAVDHGIEVPKERIHKKKDEFGTITCEIGSQDDNICMIITDDGAGIDVRHIRRKLVGKNIYSEENASRLTDKQLIEYIFEYDFSTKEDVNDISGRGFGLAAVKNEVVKMGGKIEVQSKQDAGTQFKFILPHKDISDLVEVPVECIVEEVAKKTMEVLVKTYGFQLNSNSNLYSIKSEALFFSDLTSWIEVKGLINGAFIISVNKSLAVHLAKSYLLGELSEEEVYQSIEDVLCECTNMFLGNSLELWGDMEEMILTGTPSVIRSEYRFNKDLNPEIWTCKMHFEQGDLILYFIVLNEKKFGLF